jgi:hypothetical protein
MFSMSELTSSCRKEEFVRRQNFSPLKERFFSLTGEKFFALWKPDANNFQGGMICKVL